MLRCEGFFATLAGSSHGMKVLIASSELHPYSKTGGLADMVAALAKALAAKDVQVGVVTPLYRGIQEKFPGIEPFDYGLEVPLGSERASAQVRTLKLSDRLTVYFIDHPGFYQRASLYQENGADFVDNSRRFIFFSKCVTHLARYLTWQPEIVHVHDWQAGLVPLMILDQRMREGWGSTPRTCLTIHNLAYQGVFPKTHYAWTNLPLDYFHIHGLEFYGQMNCLKAGISYADMITTVSPRYAREITTEAYGCGLDAALRKRQDRLIGILNGVDYEEWNTQNNPFIEHPYSFRKLAGKAEEKRALQEELSLPVDPTIPLFGTITRLADQKGIDIKLGALEEMLASRMQFVLLGSGSPEFEKAYRKLGERYPDKTAIRIGFDVGLSHRIEAACDFYLMPSRFEPCGLNQMYSLRYGTIPIVRRTGGLDDSVVDPADDPELADGIKFSEYSVRALSKAIRKALVIYDDKRVMRHFLKNAMTADFSWERTSLDYLRLYRQIMNL